MTWVMLQNKLDKYIGIIKTQCDQIIETQNLILNQINLGTISTNIVTRRGTETQEPQGPPWYQAEYACKARETQEMSQQEENLVDPHDDIDYEAQKKRLRLPRHNKR